MARGRRGAAQTTFSDQAPSGFSRNIRVGGNSVSIPRPLGPFPPRFRCTLTYCDQSTLTAPATTNLSASYRFALNGIYDPNVTGTGHQPMFFDQLTGLYSLYRVLRARVQVTWTNPTAEGLWCGYRILSSYNTTTSASKSLDYLREMGDTNMQQMSSLAEQIRDWKITVPIHSVLGITAQEYSAPFASYASSTAANPAILAYLDLVALSATSSAIDATFAVKILYDVEFSGFYQPGQS